MDHGKNLNELRIITCYILLYVDTGKRSIVFHFSNCVVLAVSIYVEKQTAAEQEMKSLSEDAALLWTCLHSVTDGCPEARHVRVLGYDWPTHITRTTATWLRSQRTDLTHTTES